MTPEKIWSMARESTITNSFDWTQDSIRAAVRSADQGNFQAAAELCDEILADDRVNGIIGKIAMTIFHSPIELIAGRAGFVPEGADSDWADMCDLPAFVQLLGWGLVFGIGLAQLLWRENDAGRLVPYLDVWHPRHLRYEAYRDRWFVSTAQGEEEISPGDGKWLLFTPWGIKRPWALACWRGIAPWWLKKVRACQDWDRYNEQQGNGLLWVQSDDADDNRRKALAKALNKRGRATAVVVKSGTSAELKQATPGSESTFTKAIETADTAIAIALTGVNLTTLVQGGSFAAATAHAGLELKVIQGYAGFLFACLVEQMIKPWAVVNHGGEWAAFGIKVDLQPPEDEKAKADVLLARAQAVQVIAQTPGVDGLIDLGAAFSDAGLMVPEGGPVLPEQPAQPVDPGLPTGSGSGFGAGCGHAHGVARDLLYDFDPEGGPDWFSRVPEKISASEAAQSYIDKSAADSVREARKALAPDLAYLKRIVNTSKDPQEVKARLSKLAEQMDPQVLAEATHKAILLGGMAGRWAVLEDL